MNYTVEELRKALKDYLEAVGRCEGTYFVEEITDERSRHIVSDLLHEIESES